MRACTVCRILLNVSIIGVNTNSIGIKLDIFAYTYLLNVIDYSILCGMWRRVVKLEAKLYGKQKWNGDEMDLFRGK